MKRIDSYDIIYSMLRTEKGTTMLGYNKYLFSVDKNATKIEIKKAVEEIYDVEVKKVNTMRMYGKKRRIRYKEGRRPDWKKAIVTLKEGNTIDIT